MLLHFFILEVKELRQNKPKTLGHGLLESGKDRQNSISFLS